MSLFAAGREALSAVFSANAEEMTYTSGTVSVTIPCKLGKTVFRTDSLDSAVTIRTDARDFIVRWSELALTPSKGDTVTYGGHSYTVYAPTGEPCWRPHTTEAEEIRIHALLNEVAND